MYDKVYYTVNDEAVKTNFPDAISHLRLHQMVELAKDSLDFRIRE